jgi:hypothetical protein
MRFLFFFFFCWFLSWFFNSTFSCTQYLFLWILSSIFQNGIFDLCNLFLFHTPLLFLTRNKAKKGSCQVWRLFVIIRVFCTLNVILLSLCVFFVLFWNLGFFWEDFWIEIGFFLAETRFFKNWKFKRACYGFLKFQALKVTLSHFPGSKIYFVAIYNIQNPYFCSFSVFKNCVFKSFKIQKDISQFFKP